LYNNLIDFGIPTKMVRLIKMCLNKTYGADKPLARSGRKQTTAMEDFEFRVSYILFIIIIGRMLVLFIYITRLPSNEVF
jgi:hypothetical protein